MHARLPDPWWESTRCPRTCGGSTCTLLLAALRCAVPFILLHFLCKRGKSFLYSSSEQQLKTAKKRPRFWSRRLPKTQWVNTVADRVNGTGHLGRVGFAGHATDGAMNIPSSLYPAKVNVSQRNGTEPNKRKKNKPRHCKNRAKKSVWAEVIAALTLLG